MGYTTQVENDTKWDSLIQTGAYTLHKTQLTPFYIHLALLTGRTVMAHSHNSVTQRTGLPPPFICVS